MDTLEDLFKKNCYNLDKFQKEQLFVKHLAELIEHHVENCKEYRNILSALDFNHKMMFNNIEEFPFLPVRLFKDLELMSTPKDKIVKTLTSSGTTSQKVSKIFIDRQTSMNQTKALVSILQHYLGKKRLPMLIVDHPNVIKDRRLFSARGAGILGVSNFGRDHTYVLDDNMKIDHKILDKFLDKYSDERILIFGFTFMVWQYLFTPLAESNSSIEIPHGILLHSGGWKKLEDQSVDNKTFKKGILERTGVKKIHNFYGMVEQTGSIFVECKKGFLHASNFSDLIIRDPMNWNQQAFGKEGVIEVLSILPYSYPGHILLTEDIGTVWGKDDCKCGQKGAYFSISGRIPKAEIRGCSDTHATDIKKLEG